MTAALDATTDPDAFNARRDPDGHTFPWLPSYPLVGQTVMAPLDGAWRRCLVATRHARHLDPGDLELVTDTDEVIIQDLGALRPWGHPDTLRAERP